VTPGVERARAFLAGNRLGATAVGEGVEFLVWAPRASRVDVVIGDPVERETPLEPLERGYHGGVVSGAGPGTRYRFRLDGGEPRPDPASRHQPGGVFGPSMVVETGEPSGPHWPGIPLRDLVLYELHVGAFTPERTFDAVVGRLDDLADLGVTAIELMPVAQFPGARNWGYDGVFPFAAQSTYGGPAGLGRLVAACHARELGVVLDVVHNHVGPEGNVLPRYGPYFTDRARTPWGEAPNFDGPGSDEVRRFFVESALAWIVETGVDGLRLDAVHTIVDGSAYPFLEELADAVHAAGDRLGRETLLIAESDANAPRLVRPPEKGGTGLDATWADDLHRALHAAVTGERQGPYVDFGGPAPIAKAYRDGFVFTGQRSRFRGRRHGRPADDVPPERFVVYAQTHDLVGNRAGSERLVSLVGPETAKLVTAAVLLSPFTPMLFMGEEYGETAPFPFFVDHADPALVEAVRRGRRAEYAAFGVEEVPDPADPATFEAARIDWSGRATESGSSRLALHRELLRLRSEVPALAPGERAAVDARAEGDLVIVRRAGSAGETDAVLLLHLGDEPARPELDLDEGVWRVALDTADEAWGGPGGRTDVAVEARRGRATLLLAPRSAVLLVRPGRPTSRPRRDGSTSPGRGSGGSGARRSG